MIPPPSSNNNNSTALSPAPTLVNGRFPQKYSFARRYVLLLIFCLAQFLDAANNSALFSAIPSLVEAFNITESESTWIISAFQLTFASFLLIVSISPSCDVSVSHSFAPSLERSAISTIQVSLMWRVHRHSLITLLPSSEFAFIGGFAVLGIFSLGAGFAKDKIALIILRALSGVAASLTIPSALTLLVNVFPEPTEQARAIGVFGGCGAIGNSKYMPSLNLVKFNTDSTAFSLWFDHRSDIRSIRGLALGLLVHRDDCNSNRCSLHHSHS